MHRTNEDFDADPRAKADADEGPTANAHLRTALRFETNIRANEVREAAGRTYWRFFILIGFATFGLQTLFRLQRPWRDSWDLITDLLSYALGVAIGMVAFGFGILFFSSNRIARRSQANGPVKYLITEDGIDVHEENGEAKIRWRAFAGFVEKKTLILLRLRQTRKLLIIPKRCLANAAQDELITILSNRLVRIK